MHLRKRMQSQDPLLAQQFSCYLGASSAQLALTLGGPGTSAAPSGPAAVSVSKASRLLKQLRNKFGAEKSTGDYPVQGGHLRPRKRLRLKSLEAAGYHR